MSIGTFKIRGIESGSFRTVIEKEVEVDYTGQSITYSALKIVAKNRFKFTYTGTEVSGSGDLSDHVLYEIEPVQLRDETVIPTDDTVNYILIVKKLNILLD